MHHIIHRHVGPLFGKYAIYPGILLLLIGSISFYLEAYVVAPTFTLLGCAFTFLSNGYQFDTQKQLYRHYFACFGIKLGRWNSIAHFPFVTVLAQNAVRRIHSPFIYHYVGPGSASVTQEMVLYSLCFLSKSHRKKVVAIQSVDRKMVHELAKKLSQSFGKPLVKYAPKRLSGTPPKR